MSEVEAETQSASANGTPVLATEGENKLQRGMSAGHMEMIAIGGCIGTGLLLKVGQAIWTAGPIGALICFFIVAVQVFGVMTSLGEMATYLPVDGIFSQIPNRFLNDSYGFASGWNYWINWGLTIPTELAAIGGFMAFWVPNATVPSWAWCAIYLVPLAAMNCLDAENFGDAEFGLSIIKVVAVVVFIIIAIIVWFGGVTHTGPIWFKNWETPIIGNNSVTQFNNISASFVTAFFAYAGTEMIGVAAAEAHNPRKNVPKAVYGTFIRINFFYIGAVGMLGLIMPANDPVLNPNNPSGITGSPFVYVYELVGISAAADIMNAVIIIACLSATNSSIYVCARTMMRLADEGNAPKILGYVTKGGVPLYALIFSVAFGVLSIIGGYLGGTNVAFNFLSSLVSLGILGAWMTMSFAHVRFRAGYLAQGYKLEDLPYVAPFYPWLDYLSLIIGVFVIVIMIFGAFYQVTDFTTTWWLNTSWLYGGLGIIFVLFFGKIIFEGIKAGNIMEGFKLVPYEDMDFETGKLVETAEDLLDVDKSMKETVQDWIAKAKQLTNANGKKEEKVPSPEEA
ncbi:hypothetical protein HDU98_000299 [Podochytrium sp. JEL0797]|nr:hypothetical protein HDU98_000299 [Podochytrium sp. JEL0797]